MTTSKATRTPAGDGFEVMEKYGRRTEGGGGRQRIERGHGMVTPITSIELGGKAYHPPSGGREQRLAADHPAVLRRPDLFRLCSDDDGSLAAERFTEARSRAGLSGSGVSRAGGVFGLDFGPTATRRPRKDEPMFGLERSE